MNIRQQLAKHHSKQETEKIVAYVGTNSARFKELVNIYLEGPYRITQRAAWPLSYCIQHHPSLLQPYYSKLIQFAGKPEVHPAVKRNTLRMLRFAPMPRKHHAAIINLAFNFLNNPKEAIAIKAFSLHVLTRLAEEHPDIKNEILDVIEQHLPFASPAFTVAARKTKKVLENL